MLKKRLIFILFYCDGYFMQSRNFSLQRVGDINWIKTNYNFSHISFYIDELIIIDVSRQNSQSEDFYITLEKISSESFVPISAGGGIRDIEQARKCLRSGADKIILNYCLYENLNIVHNLASEFGEQCIVASIDVKKNLKMNSYDVFRSFGQYQVSNDFVETLNKVLLLPVGELFINSIDKDGTGQGLDFELLDTINCDLPKPLIFAGGIGNTNHFIEGFNSSKIDAIATGNLFNFIGNSLKNSREALIKTDILLPNWNYEAFNNLKKIFS